MKNKVILEKYNGKKFGWLKDGLWFVGILAAIIVVFNCIIGVSAVDGDSMEPTLCDGQKVVYFRLNKKPKVGDLVCIWVPSGDYYVKRVVASGGDIVDIEDGNLYVNGELIEEEYIQGQTTEVRESAVVFPYEVRENNYFVLGDNRERSKDSRTFGEVNRGQIHGIIFFSSK